MAPKKQSALSEMSRLLDRAPAVGSAIYPGAVRVTSPWCHGELHDTTQAMSEHVLMTYYGAPRDITCTTGRMRRTAMTRPGTVTVIPAGYTARWDIDGAIDVSHVYLPVTRLLSSSGAACELRHCVAVEDATLAHLLAIIASEAQATDAPARMLVEHALEMVLLQISRRHAAVRTNRGELGTGLARWQLRRVVEYATEKYGEAITLEELAALVGLSRFHFCSAFHRSMGMPPYKWLRAIRMKQAKQLLLGTRLAIVDIAAQVGYESASAFAKAFKAVEGVTPAFFRKTS